MQEITTLPFWTCVAARGGPDLYVTEYFRVHTDSTPEPKILRSLDQNPSGRPALAQMIGRDIPAMVRTIGQLLEHPVAGVDLNLGCPAPTVCSKQAGGGLLRNPAEIDSILGALREAVPADRAFTVKTRIGWQDPAEFDELLAVFQKHSIDALAVHGRTVKERYATSVHYDRIRDAVEAMDCPVFANGNIVSPERAQQVVVDTAAAGLMIGRGGIRNPWLFDQIRGTRSTGPTLREMKAYIEHLSEQTKPAKGYDDLRHTRQLKRFLNYIAQGISDGEFLTEVQHCQDSETFREICQRHLDSDELLPPDPPTTTKYFQGL